MSIIDEIHSKIRFEKALWDANTAVYKELATYKKVKRTEARKNKNKTQKVETVHKSNQEKPKSSLDFEERTRKSAVESMIFRATRFIQDEEFCLQHKEQCRNLWKEFESMQGKEPDDMHEEFYRSFDKLSNLRIKYDI